MDIHRTHNICHGYNCNIIISMITSRAYSQQPLLNDGPTPWLPRMKSPAKGTKSPAKRIPLRE